ncbi:MAG: HD domain-containing protein [Thermomicrobiales bacterium]|nr:HD domain-containing protein [Thermomicrobiales bacterium]
MSLSGNAEALVATIAGMPELGVHATRVTSLAVRIVELRADASDAMIDVAVQSAHWHDLGKLAIPATILDKPARLTEQEYTLVQQHPAISHAMATTMAVDEDVCLAARHHHEWWNGRGYPDRLTGESIPLMARIIAVADAYDAMTSDRPYRAAMPASEAIAELERGAGVQFDPSIVPLLVRLETT